MRRNAFRTNVYVRPLAYKSAERVGVSLDDQDAFAVIALPFGEYLHKEEGLHAASVHGAGSTTMQFPQERRSAEPT